MKTAATLLCLATNLLFLQLPTACEPCEEGFCNVNENRQPQMLTSKLTFTDKAGKVFSKIKRNVMAWRSSGGSNEELVNNLRSKLTVFLLPNCFVVLIIFAFLFFLPGKS